MACYAYIIHKLNSESVFRLFNAKYLLLRPFLLLTWVNNQNKKELNFFIDM